MQSGAILYFFSLVCKEPEEYMRPKPDFSSTFVCFFLSVLSNLEIIQLFPKLLHCPGSDLPFSVSLSRHELRKVVKFPLISELCLLLPGAGEGLWARALWGS